MINLSFFIPPYDNQIIELVIDTFDGIFMNKPSRSQQRLTRADGQNAERHRVICLKMVPRIRLSMQVQTTKAKIFQPTHRPLAGGLAVHCHRFTGPIERMSFRAETSLTIIKMLPRMPRKFFAFP